MDNVTTITPVFKLNGHHVPSYTREYHEIVRFFDTDSFASCVKSRTIDTELVDNISISLTSYLQTFESDIISFDNSVKATCKHICTVNSDTKHQVVLYVDITIPTLF